MSNKHLPKRKKPVHLTYECGCPCHEPGANILHFKECCHPCRDCGVMISGINHQCKKTEEFVPPSES